MKRMPNRTVLLPDRPGTPPMAALPEPEVLDIPALLSDYESGRVELICVLGPTASGKTRFAVSLARELNRLRAASGSPRAGAEILSADSRQVYRGMDIGTGKDLAEYGEIPYHLIDLVPAGSRYNLYAWQQAFEEAYRSVRDRGGIPILCGGTGLYIEAAVRAYLLPVFAPDPARRAAWERLSHEELRRRVLELRPDTPEGVLQSKKRTVRALEVAVYEREHPAERTGFQPKKTFFIGTLVGREERVARIDRRLAERLGETPAGNPLSAPESASGPGTLVGEVRALLAAGIAPEDLMYYGLEYKYVTQYVLGILSYEEMKILLSNAIHQFAKRQMTWFRGMERREGVHIHWVRP